MSVVYSAEDQTEGDAEIDDVDDTVVRSDESVVSTSDADVRETDVSEQRSFQ